MRAAAVLLVFLTGCQAVKDKATDYLSDVAVEQVTKAVDKKLEERGLSLAQLKTIADSDGSGDVSKAEVVSLAKESIKDYVMLTAETKSEEAKKELSGKLSMLAEASDLEDLKAKAAQVDLFGKSTMGLLISAILGYVIKQVFSAKSDARRDARLDFLERISGRDLDGDGYIGGAPNIAPPVQQGQPQPTA